MQDLSDADNNAHTLRAVQFLHGGTEPPALPGTPAWYPRVAAVHAPASSYTPWNMTDTHRRKFMASPARFVRTLEALPERGTVGFWGEWEPPSLADGVPSPVDRGPHWVHRPVLANDGYEWQRAFGERHGSTTKGKCQNTDPFVFGCEFYYFGCHQEAFPMLRRLERGSVILFGSCQAHNFVLDTVFVVADYLYWPHDRDEIIRRTPTVWQIATMEQVPPDIELTLYIGATYERPFRGMYSFVPCTPRVDASHGFARPVIDWSDVLNFIRPGQTQSISTEHLRDLSAAHRVWEEVANIVTGPENDLCLGFEVEMPANVV